MFDFRKGERFLKRLRKERKIFQKYWKLKRVKKKVTTQKNQQTDTVKMWKEKH